MKKTFLIVIPAIILIVVVLVFLNTSPTSQKSTDVLNVGSKTNDGKTIGIQEVATHSTAVDCWEVINGKVYNLTAYAPKHPGGSKKVTDFCGSNASEVFNAVDKHQRPGIAEELTTYYLGEFR